MVLTRDFWCDGQTTILSHAARYLKEKIKNGLGDVLDVCNVSPLYYEKNVKFLRLSTLLLVSSIATRGCVL